MIGFVRKMCSAKNDFESLLTPNFTYVVKNLRTIPVLDKSKENGYLNNEEYSQLLKIAKNESEEGSNRVLLTQHLNKRGPNAFKDFVKMLRETGQSHIADRLTKSNGDRDEPQAALGAPVTENHVYVVARYCSGKWKALGRVLMDCDTNRVLDIVSGLPSTDNNSEKLRFIIEAWLNKNTDATVQQLVDACGREGVDCGGIVTRKLKEKGLL
jgi:hypothetical protein